MEIAFDLEKSIMVYGVSSLSFVVHCYVQAYLIVILLANVPLIVVKIRSECNQAFFV